MKVFLIHDPLRKDRELLYKEELRVQEIGAYEMITAVKEYVNVPKNISEVHKSCIRRAITEDLERVVILEDDVKFSAQGAYNEFLRLSEMLPEDWDLFTAGSYDYKILGHGGKPVEPFCQVQRFSGLHCYVVHKRYYQRFLDTRGVNNLDKALEGNLWMMWPMAALQWDTYSANVKKITNYNTTFIKKIKLWTSRII